MTTISPQRLTDTVRLGAIKAAIRLSESARCIHADATLAKPCRTKKSGGSDGKG